MVTDYKPSNCKYTYDKLKSVIYLVSESHSKVFTDTGDNAVITDLSELPLRLNGFNIKFNEEASLDERYLFQKTVTLSMHGYVDHNIFGGRYYIILESMDGTFWMVNIDFPSKVTYTFNLSNNTYQTDFTLSSYSNFPTLRLMEEFEAVSPLCLGFNTYGIESLKLIEKDYVVLDTNTKTTYTYGNTFKDVEFMGNSCSFRSQFDGEKCTDTVTFNIPFDSYKSSWQYNLLEFVNNRYSAIIKPKSSSNTFFTGFNFGLQPTYTIETSDNAGESDIVTITMTEMSNEGCTAALSWSEEQSTQTRWIYVKNVGDVICWECVGRGRARYLVQSKVLANGVATGEYKVLEGYEDDYDMLNVVGTFSDDELFDNNACAGDSCNISTNIPINIQFNETGCTTYTYRSDCDWSIEDLTANWLTVTPTSGNGETTYTITVCNSTTDSNGTSFSINSGGNVRVVNVTVKDGSSFVNPSQVSINCLSQTVNFTYSQACPITVIGHDDRTTYQINSGRLTVQVPSNPSLSSTTYNYTVRDCSGNTQTLHIIQDRTYERWVDTGGYICSNGNSYHQETRYTGTTSDNINTYAGETRMGSLIQSGDTRCANSSERWVESYDYICIDGDKWSFEQRELSYDNGEEWYPTGEIRPLAMVEEASSFCEQAEVVSWRLKSSWVCEEEEETDKIKALLYTSDSVLKVGYNNSDVLTRAEIIAKAPISSITAIEIGEFTTSLESGVLESARSLTAVSFANSVTTIPSGAFRDCNNLVNISLPSGLSTIGYQAFMDCTSLRYIALPNRLASIGEEAFANCSSLTGATIPYSIAGNDKVGDYAYRDCQSLRNLILSTRMSEIPEGMCYNDTGLQSIEIPTSVQTIENWAFSSCFNLTVTMDSTEPPVLDLGGSSRYNHFTGVKTIYVPTASLTAYTTAAGWSEFANKIRGV